MARPPDSNPAPKADALPSNRGGHVRMFVALSITPWIIFIMLTNLYRQSVCIPMVFLLLHLAEEERSGCLCFCCRVAVRVLCLFFALPWGWSLVCDCGSSLSYSLAFGFRFVMRETEKG